MVGEDRDHPADQLTTCHVRPPSVVEAAPSWPTATHVVAVGHEMLLTTNPGGVVLVHVDPPLIDWKATGVGPVAASTRPTTKQTLAVGQDNPSTSASAVREAAGSGSGEGDQVVPPSEVTKASAGIATLRATQCIADAHVNDVACHCP
ncbi:MAG TPA: hypothetical protein VK277_13695 [Acidimicrobiales bacterium]|nr:hypothetical protein [Acidimicrobiales bacterium]